MRQIVLIVEFAAWYFAARWLAWSAAEGLSFRFDMGPARSLLEACFQLFLLVLGYMAFRLLARRGVTTRELVALPRRKTAGREWLQGVAIGWGMVVAAILPLIVTGRLRAQISFSAGGLWAALLTIVALGIAVLAHEIALRGYPLQCLIDLLGPTLAVLVMMAAVGFAAWLDPYTPASGVLAAMLMALLLSLGWLRTHAIWLSWGLHFALVVCMGVMFGLPVGGSSYARAMVRGGAYVVQARTVGPDWLTGGDAGLAGALFSLVVLLGGVIVLYRTTRDYAWDYTHRPIVAAGYPVVVAPPAAHTAMEAKAPGLVQILPVTPRDTSAVAPPPVPPPPRPDRIH